MPAISPREEIARLFSTVGDLPNLRPNSNVAPTQPDMVARRHPESGKRSLAAAGEQAQRATMATVYHARVWDHQKGEHVITPQKWAAEAMRMMRTGTVLPKNGGIRAR